MEATDLRLSRDRHYISPYVFAVFVALREKGLPFTFEAIDIGGGAQRDPGYAAASVTARVPALTHLGPHGTFTLAESSAIVEYLEEAFPGPTYARVLPADLRERARARQLMAWIRSDDTLPIREHRSTATMFYEKATTPVPAAASAAVEKLFSVASRVVKSSDQPLFGDFSIIDADLAFILMRLVMNDDPVPDLLREYAKHQFTRPSIRAFLEIERPAYIPY